MDKFTGLVLDAHPVLLGPAGTIPNVLTPLDTNGVMVLEGTDAIRALIPDLLAKVQTTMDQSPYYAPGATIEEVQAHGPGFGGVSGLAGSQGDDLKGVFQQCHEHILEPFNTSNITNPKLDSKNLQTDRLRIQAALMPVPASAPKKLKLLGSPEPAHQDWSAAPAGPNRVFGGFLNLCPEQTLKFQYVSGTHFYHVEQQTTTTNGFTAVTKSMQARLVAHKEFVEIGPGEAVIFDEKLIHFVAPTPVVPGSPVVRLHFKIYLTCGAVTTDQHERAVADHFGLYPNPSPLIPSGLGRDEQHQTAVPTLYPVNSPARWIRYSAFFAVNVRSWYTFLLSTVFGSKHKEGMPLPANVRGIIEYNYDAFGQLQLKLVGKRAQRAPGGPPVRNEMLHLHPKDYPEIAAGIPVEWTTDKFNFRDGYKSTPIGPPKAPPAVPTRAFAADGERPAKVHRVV
jgi:hypothetical protein